MIHFFRGLKNAIMGKTISDEQILYCEDTGELMIDKKESGQEGTRHVVRDPLAGTLEGNTFLIL